MDFKVIFRETFVSDLEAIVRHVARHNPDAAARLGEKIISAAESLSFFPERFPTVRSRAEIRRFIAARWFKVFYRIHADAKSVEILRCWDGRRKADPKFD
jgi:plasmid stabilization system protein ParE